MTKLSRNALRRIIDENIKGMIDEDWVGEKDRHTPPLGSRANRETSGIHLDNRLEVDIDSCPMCGISHDEHEGCGYEDEDIEYLNESCGCNQSNPEMNTNNGEMDVHDLMKISNAFPDASHVVGIDHPDDSRSSYMARPQLSKVAEYASKLLSMIEEGEELMDWQESHIAQLADDISEVYHSIAYRKHKGEF